MAGSKSDAHSDDVLNVLRNVTLTAIATVYIELYSVAPDDTGGGTISGEGRVSAGTLTAPADGGVDGRQIDNAGTIEWAGWGAGSQTLVAFAVFDAITVGNFLYWADLDTNRAIADGETARFDIGALVIAED